MNGAIRSSLYAKIIITGKVFSKERRPTDRSKILSAGCLYFVFICADYPPKTPHNDNFVIVDYAIMRLCDYAIALLSKKSQNKNAPLTHWSAGRHYLM